MMRVVVDTNILISAILSPGGLANRVLRHERDGTIELAFSPATIEEALRVLRSEKIRALLHKRGVLLSKAEQFLDILFRSSFVTEDKVTVEAIEEDPADNKFLACAIEAHADFIVSGDSHLNSLKSFHGIEIVDPHIFLKLMQRMYEQ